MMKRETRQVNLTNKKNIISHSPNNLLAIISHLNCVCSNWILLFSFCLSFFLFVAPPVSVDGTVAYCAQQPWIRNGALRHNILFGESLNATKYREAIRVCSMEDDIQTITGGNNAEIGERGINLSGGQKARVSLARAVYSDRDIYLLDDILSAVRNFSLLWTILFSRFDRPLTLIFVF